MGNDCLAFPRGCALLKDITETEYRELCVWLKARERHLLNRQSLVGENDPCKWIGIVLSGAIRLTRSRMDGGRNVLETVATNDTFGATYVFRGQPTMGIAMSAVGETSVIVFDVGDMLECGHVVKLGHLKFLRNLLTVMSQKTFQIKQKLRILSQRTIRGRLLLLLNILAKRAKSLEFDIPFDRQSLADYLCVERSALSAEISKLRREGLLESTKNHFRLIDGRERCSVRPL